MKKLFLLIVLLLLTLSGCGTQDSSSVDNNKETEKNEVTEVEGIVYSEAGSYTINTDETVRITSADVELTDSIINGDLIIEESVGDGEVMLNNVTLNGELIVRGGGQNSIKLTGTTTIVLIIIEKKDSPVRIDASENVVVEEIQSNEATAKIIIDGTGTYSKIYISDGEELELREDVIIDYIEIIAEGLEFTSDSEIETLVITGKNVSFNNDGSVMSISIEATGFSVESSGDIESIVAQANATGAQIAGEGQVASIIIYANNVNITADGTDLEIEDGVEGTFANGEQMDEGTIIFLVVTQNVKPTPTPTPVPTAIPAVTKTVSVVNTAPTVPTNLKASQADLSNSIILNWDKSTDDSSVKLYEIYDNNVLVAKTTLTTYNINNLDGATEFSYKVRALDYCGLYSAYTDEIKLNIELKPMFTTVIENDGKIEGLEDGKKISINVKYDSFVKEQSITTNLLLKGLPEGVSLSTVTYIDANNIELMLSGISTVDYDENLTLDINLSSDMLDGSTDNIDLETTIVGNLESKPAMPAVSIAKDEVSGTKLIGINDSMEIQYTNMTQYPPYNWMVYSEGMCEHINSIYSSVEEGYFVIYVRYKETLRTEASEMQIITVTNEYFNPFKASFSFFNPVYIGFEDQRKINLIITDGTFSSENILLKYISSDLPDGVSISEVNYLTTNEIELTLAGNRTATTDLESDYLRSEFVLEKEMFNDVNGDVKAYYYFENTDNIDLSVTPKATLYKGTNNGVKICLEMATSSRQTQYKILDENGDLYKDWTNFSQEELIVDNIDIATGYQVIIRDSVTGMNMYSNELTLDVTDSLLEEGAVSKICISLFSDKAITAGNEDGIHINVILENIEFQESMVNLDNIELVYEAGVSISDVDYINPNKIQITFSGNAEVPANVGDMNNYSLTLKEGIVKNDLPEFTSDFTHINEGTKLTNPNGKISVDDQGNYYYIDSEFYNDECNYQYSVEDSMGNVLKEWSEVPSGFIIELNTGDIVQIINKTTDNPLKFDSDILTLNVIDAIVMGDVLRGDDFPYPPEGYISFGIDYHVVNDDYSSHEYLDIPNQPSSYCVKEGMTWKEFVANENSQLYFGGNSNYVLNDYTLISWTGADLNSTTVLLEVDSPITFHPYSCTLMRN